MVIGENNRCERDREALQVVLTIVFSRSGMGQDLRDQVLACGVSTPKTLPMFGVDFVACHRPQTYSSLAVKPAKANKQKKFGSGQA